METQVKTASIISVLFAIWLFVSPYVLGFAGVSIAAMWVVIIGGIAVFALSLLRFIDPGVGPAPSWINAVIGLALIVFPFVWSLMGPGLSAVILWDFVIVGIAYVVLNVWAALGHLIRI